MALLVHYESLEGDWQGESILYYWPRSCLTYLFTKTKACTRTKHVFHFTREYIYFCYIGSLKNFRSGLPKWIPRTAQMEKDGTGYCRRHSPFTGIANCTHLPSLSHLCHCFFKFASVTPLLKGPNWFYSTNASLGLGTSFPVAKCTWPDFLITGFGAYSSHLSDRSIQSAVHTLCLLVLMDSRTIPGINDSNNLTPRLKSLRMSNGRKETERERYGIPVLGFFAVRMLPIISASVQP